MHRTRVALAIALTLSIVTLAERPAGAADDPWRALEGLRSALAAAGPLSARFEQSYLPAGFSAGDSESGDLALSLPDCLRWDYSEPYRKSFLVCGSRAWSWVEGEPRGQRFTIEADREMGLDLLLLPADELAVRYRASAHRLADGALELTLEPKAENAQVVVASLTLESSGELPRTLEWRDGEGNVSSFHFSAWQPLADGEPFAPPPALEWSEPEASGDLR